MDRDDSVLEQHGPLDRLWELARAGAEAFGRNQGNEDQFYTEIREEIEDLYKKVEEAEELAECVYDRTFWRVSPNEDGKHQVDHDEIEEMFRKANKFLARHTTSDQEETVDKEKHGVRPEQPEEPPNVEPPDPDFVTGGDVEMDESSVPESDHYDFYREWDYEIRVTGYGVVVRAWDYEAPKTEEYVMETRVDPREVGEKDLYGDVWGQIRLGLARLNSRREEKMRGFGDD